MEIHAEDIVSNLNTGIAYLSVADTSNVLINPALEVSPQREQGVLLYLVRSYTEFSKKSSTLVIG